MNERIKDIFDQACFETDYDDVQNLRETMDRFAELIIQECAEICLEANDHKNILNHFGIKP